jgi:hypothetical protein
MEPYAPVAEQYAEFARWSRKESPCFAAWARGVADDAEVLAVLAGLPKVKQQPNLVFAAARWHGVPAPGPYGGLRAALLGDDGTIRETILGRSTQTNEVGRLATLYPAFAEAAPNGEKPLALLEVGASAGLCLYPDLFHLRWSFPNGGIQETDPIGPLIDCATTGDLSVGALPPVVWRAGIDLNPLDVTDDDAMRWLETLVWPEQDARRERLRAAVRIARRDPPYLVRGGLLDGLPALLDEAPADATVVVFHSAVIAYLEHQDRERFARLMAGLVEDGRCHWVSNEGPRVLPGLVPADTHIPFGRFVLAVDGHAVALTHGHGAELDWL